MDERRRFIENESIIIEEAPVHENYEDNNKYIKIDGNAASMISQLLTSNAVGNALNGAYRVEFPNGISGALVPHGDGYLAILRDPVTNKFAGQGTLYSLDNVGLMYSTFSVLSMATGQYFMKQINQNLQEIQSKMDMILDFLYTDKTCEIYAEAKMVFGIYRNCTSIMHRDAQRIASLQTVQKAKILAERNIQFFYRDMRKLASKHGSMENLQNDLNNYTQAVSIFGVCSVLEIVLSENYDETFLKYIESDLKRHVEKHHEEVGQLKGMIINLPKSNPPAFFAAPKPDPKRQQLLKYIDSLLGANSPVKGYAEIIAQMRTEYTNRSEYRITSDGAVYKCK